MRKSVIKRSMIRAAIYARASTAAQEDSTDTQIERAKAYIGQRPGWIHVRTFVDEALSRAEYRKRPDLFATLAAADDDEFDVLVMRDVDRLGGDQFRNGVILQDLADSGIEVHEYKDGGGQYRTDDATAKFVALAKNYAADIEREKTSFRTREALAEKARKGWNAGGCCFGYKRVEIPGDDGERDHVEDYPDEREAPIVGEIWRRWGSGEGYRGIARDLNARGVRAPKVGRRGSGIWSGRLVREIVHNRRYLGFLPYGETVKRYRKGTKVRERRDVTDKDFFVVQELRLRIIPDDVAALVEERMKTKKPGRTGRGRKAAYLLTGIARCGLCGGPMQIQRSRKRRVYFCAYHNDKGNTVCTNSLRRPAEEAERSVVGWINRNILDDEDVIVEIFREVSKRVRERSRTTNDEIPRIESELKKLGAEISQLAEAVALTDGKVAELAKKLSERQERVTAMEARLALLRSAPDVLTLEAKRLEKETRAQLKKFRQALHGDLSQAREALHTLLENGLKFIPRERDGRRYYRIEGTVTLGRVLHAATGLEKLRPQGDSNPR
jgi:site-specific DNA recombinase